MKPRNLLIAAVLLAILSGAVWWAKKHPSSGTSTTGPSAANTSTKLVEVPDSKIESIDLKKKDGSQISLSRQNNKWALTTPQKLPTDQDAVNSLASSLNPVNADNLVEDKTTDLAKYGLTSPSLTVTVREKGGKTDEIAFGDDIPAGSQVYARVGNEPKVYAVASSVKTSLDKSPNDLRDKRLLTFDTNNLTRLDLVSGKSNIEFGKNNRGEWQILKPQPYRADSFQVEELIRKLSDAKMDLSTSAEDAKKATTGFASGQPVAAAKVTDASGTQTLDLRKNKDDYYDKSSVVPGAFKVSADLGKDLAKSLDDFRTKKLFDFGFSDPTKIDVTENGDTKTYLRSGTDWKLNGKTMDSGSVQSFIDKVRDLTASKFTNGSFPNPAISIGVSSEVASNKTKRFEKVDLAKSGDGYIARRENETALYQLDDKAVKDILDASKAIKPASAPAKK